MTGVAAAALVVAAVPATAAPPVFPDVISLPDGFQPEGIAIGGGPTAYAGSLADGDIVEVNLRTGQVARLVDVDDGPAVGLSLSPGARQLFVAGGPAGTLKVYDTRSGDELADVALGAGFVNDVVVTRDAAYLTNSFAPEFYRVPLDAAGLPTGDVDVVAFEGDWQQVGMFNANGIDATPNGRHLLVINSTLGLLYEVDPMTGEATGIAIDGSLSSGDGIELTNARTVQIVRNQLNLVTTVALSADLASGTVVSEVTDPDFDVPTTIASLGSRSWVVNARFGTPPTPDTPYTLVRVG